jgi:hypothetical protein
LRSLLKKLLSFERRSHRAGSGCRIAWEVDTLFAAMSPRAGAPFTSSIRARTYGVRPGEDATGVKSGFWSLPTRMPE